VERLPDHHKDLIEITNISMKVAKGTNWWVKEPSTTSLHHNTEIPVVAITDVVVKSEEPAAALSTTSKMIMNDKSAASIPVTEHQLQQNS